MTGKLVNHIIARLTASYWRVVSAEYGTCLPTLILCSISITLLITSIALNVKIFVSFIYY